MKINVILKDEQKEFLDQIISDHSLTNVETSIQSLVSKILEKNDIDPEFVAGLIHGADAAGTERNLFNWSEGKNSFETEDHTLAHLIHGPVDCDQLDYLLRDAHFTGVAHGVVDHLRLVECLERHSGDVAVKEGGVPALEVMLMARGLMYSAVYFHKVT